MQESRGPQGLSKEDLEKFNREMDLLKKENKMASNQDVDAMTEVSTRTDESELGPQENSLDLRVTSASFDRVMLTQLLTQN